MRPDELEKQLPQRLNALGPAPRAELLDVLMLPTSSGPTGSASSGGTRRRGTSPSSSFTIDPPVGDNFTVQTDATGVASLDGLEGGSYSVTETVPEGYAAAGDLTKSATVTEGTACADTPYTGGSVSFVNIPLTDLDVTVTSQVVGGTDSQISCVNDAAPLVVIASHDTDATGTGTASVDDLLPGEYTCTIVIDP